jgi:hypothetical protein
MLTRRCIPQGCYFASDNEILPFDRTLRTNKQNTVLDGLDFREKGGYTRAVVEVHHSGTGVRLSYFLPRFLSARDGGHVVVVVVMCSS